MVRKLKMSESVESNEFLNRFIRDVDVITDVDRLYVYLRKLFKEESERQGLDNKWFNLDIDTQNNLVLLYSELFDNDYDGQAYKVDFNPIEQIFQIVLYGVKNNKCTWEQEGSYLKCEKDIIRDTVDKIRWLKSQVV
jgi:hypothetical protein